MRNDPDFQDDLDVYFYSGTSRKKKSRKPETNIWQRLSGVMEIVIVVLAILAVVRLFTPELDRKRELTNELERLTKIKEEKAAEVARIKSEHKNLTTDNRYLETVARDHLNPQKDGEYIVRIERK